MLKIEVDAGAKLHLLSEEGGKQSSRGKLVEVVPHGSGKVFCAATDQRSCAVVEMNGEADGIHGVDGSVFNVRREEKCVVVAADQNLRERSCLVKGEAKTSSFETGSPHRMETVFPAIEEGQYFTVTIDAKQLLDVAKAMCAHENQVTLIVRTKESKLSSREIGEILDEARPDRDMVAKLCENLEFSEHTGYCTIKGGWGGFVISLIPDEDGALKVCVSYSAVTESLASVSNLGPSVPRGTYDVADALLKSYDDRKIAKMAAAVDTQQAVAVVPVNSRLKAIGCVSHIHSGSLAIEKYNSIRGEFVMAAMGGIDGS